MYEICWRSIFLQSSLLAGAEESRLQQHCRSGLWGSGKVPTRNDLHEKLGVPCPKVLLDEVRPPCSAEGVHFSFYVAAGASGVVPPPNNHPSG